VSYSLREPEWPVGCECKYDEARDEMDREDCPFHYELADKREESKTQLPQRRRPGVKRNSEQAA
jgi:hypothetical protein